ncbi:hypothetical protein FF38_04381 [Lucilia cuprina]|uniref:Uncharacterized protein n=1 Tax=Lucilia cuprina TaxID=7375 RepID=A0A0L0C9I8_LUCCU|nr:hypothetical protein FF38_04381 [Lucilia cuprina]
MFMDTPKLQPISSTSRNNDKKVPFINNGNQNNNSNNNNNTNTCSSGSNITSKTTTACSNYTHSSKGLALDVPTNDKKEENVLPVK